jgi:hypothetical protein
MVTLLYKFLDKSINPAISSRKLRKYSDQFIQKIYYPSIPNFLEANQKKRSGVSLPS